jgi:peroxiredoxin
VAEAFGLAFTLPPDLKELYAAFGNALDKFHDEPDFRLPMPARYVVDQDRRIRAADVNPDYTVRPEPEDTVAVVRRLQAAGSKAARHEEGRR